MGAAKGTTPWNAGTGKGWLDRRGYRWIRVDGRSIRQHRHIMETLLGRKLSAQEVVHHKNGNVSDNRAENLEVISNGEHTRVHHKGIKRPDLVRARISRAARDRAVISDLLAACEAALFEITDIERQGQHRDNPLPTMLRAAIAKAGGGE